MVDHINEDDSSESMELMVKLSELSGFSDDIIKVFCRASQFNGRLHTLHSNYIGNVQAFSNILSSISKNYMMYKRLEKKVDNLSRLNVLMESYIQCIQLPEELVEAVENDDIDETYLLKHTYFLAKLDLCNQIQHENYPSLVWARVKLKQLLDLANKRIYHQLRKLMEDSFKSNDFSTLLDNKSLYDHLFKYSALTEELRIEYSQALRKIYSDDSLLDSFKLLERFAGRSAPKSRFGLNIAKYMDRIFITDSREYLLSDEKLLSDDFSRDNFSRDNFSRCDFSRCDFSRGDNFVKQGDFSNTPEGIFNQIMGKIISYSNNELVMASKLFDICDESCGVDYRIERDYSEIREIFLPVFEKLMDRCRVYLSNSDDIVGHLLILTIAMDSINYFESNGYPRYQELVSGLKLMFAAKAQNIISNVINEMLDYNRNCVRNSLEYLKMPINIPDRNIESVGRFIAVCMRIIHLYGFEDIVKLLNGLVETTVNSVVSLAALQANKTKEDIYTINQLAVLASSCNSIACKNIFQRLDGLYRETCNRHISFQIRLMFKPVIQVTSECEIDRLLSLSRDFISSYKKILENVDSACKQHFFSSDTHILVSQNAKKTVADIWTEFVEKLEVFREKNPSEEADGLCKIPKILEFN